MSFKSIRRAGTVGAAVTAALAIGPAALAHHCYRDAWQDAAYQQVQSGTPWTPLSDFLAFAVTEEFGGSPACVAHADQWVAGWMGDKGLTQEPLIFTKATVAGGAADRNGKDVKPFSYLTDADFGTFVGDVLSEPDCAGVQFPDGP